MFFCFKQKTAYEMRISDWSSDVCSSDLTPTMRGVIDLDSGGVTVRVGVLGGGNVGGPLIELIAARGHEIGARTGLRLQVTRIAVRDVGKARSVALPSELLTTDARSIVGDPDHAVNVEGMNREGGLVGK